MPLTKEVELSDGRRMPAELVLFSVGVRPELALARAAGLEIGPAGGLAVDDRLRTSENRQGRIAATNALGGASRCSVRNLPGKGCIFAIELPVAMA